uniref:Retrovirus-related Pol polyprotein from transposon TNT 1-94 n=1 Tax=Nicotiana tabacum TaxID=4097 RepID=A0A1S4D171_TOBAC|nr:PREDICTED: uncharacterized protein LOC107824890 [Nicotiana tabacum]
MGEASYVIGIEIFRDRSQGLLGLSRKDYIERILERFNMNNYFAGIVPIQKGDKFSLMQCPKNDVDRKEMEIIRYSSVVGSLMYAQTCTRLDISFAVGMLERYQSNPGTDHWKAAKKISLDVLTLENPRLVICSNKLKEQYRGKVPNRLGVVDTISKPLKIYCDNSAAVFFSKNDKYSKGAKHMELKYFTVKEEVQKQRVSLEHITTDLMIADPLTKGLQPKIFKEHVHRMGIDCIYD